MASAYLLRSLILSLTTSWTENQLDVVVFVRQREEDCHKFDVSLVYRSCSRLVKSHIARLCLKKSKNGGGEEKGKEKNKKISDSKLMCGSMEYSDFCVFFFPHIAGFCTWKPAV